MNSSNIGHVYRGIEEAKQGNSLLGLKMFNSSEDVANVPEAKAWHGYCLARVNKEYRRGIALCKEALQAEPTSSDIYLALGRIYLLAGVRALAIRTLQEGWNLDKNREIDRLLRSIGVRKPPVFRFLERKNRVNVFSGMVLTRIGLR